MHWEHLKLLHLLKNRELDEIYISIFFRTFAFALVTIFIPLYLLNELGYSFQEVLIFYFIFYGLMGIFAPFAGRVASSFGLKHTMLASIPLMILHYFLLFSLKYGKIHYTIPALIGCLAITLFWVSFHSDFANFSSNKKGGQQTSVWIAINSGAATIAPIIGAVMITRTGNFNFLFLLVITIGMLSMIPLFFSKDTHPKTAFEYNKIFHKRRFKESISLAGAGFRGMSTVFWPILIFLILGTYLDLGKIASLSGLFVSMFAIFSGQLTIKMRYKNIIAIGTIFNSVTWFIRSFFRTFFSLFAVTFAGLLSFTFADVAFHARAYTRARKSHHVLNYIVYREICYSLGRIVLLLILFGLYHFMSNNFVQEIALKNTLTGAFIVTGLAVLAMNFS